MGPGILYFVVIVGLYSSWAGQSSGKKEDKAAVDRRPNFVILFADDIGYGDLGANQQSSAQSDTPFMDMLASRGTRFTDFHAGASVCTPSRAALMTGRLGKRTGVVKNFSLSSAGGLPLNETTFAETFKAAGYQTGLIGKWHLGHRGPFHPNRRGFDSYYGLIESNDIGCVDDPGYNIPPCPSCANCSSDDHHVCYNKVAVPLFGNSSIKEQPANLVTLGGSYYEHARIFIRQSVQAVAPFLLYVAFAHTHVPLQYDPKFANSSARGPFGNTLRELDYIIQGIATEIRIAGIESNTLLWFTGDNGPWEQKCEYAGDNGPFHGLWQKQKGGGGSTGKQTVWEGGHREPAFAYWPGRVPAGRVSDSLLSALDIFPTIASIAGILMPKDRSYDGMDVKEVLFGKDLHNRTLFHPTNVKARVAGAIDAVRHGAYKAVYQTGGEEQCGGLTGPIQRHDPPLVFNLQTDPQEGSPLDPHSEEYNSALTAIERSLEAFRADLARDNTTEADYSQNDKYIPCCNQQNHKCRCHEL
ncbi:arylsulfatase G-like [Patiria miniata]|uniref:Sulfatase N-terminal domain-containing protein n=1 Tax=Patiria miniata TaxID=46514 RepID=A0A914AUM5_PATMI|nr:arylsulfatase G-like [Patiria miniata]